MVSIKIHVHNFRATSLTSALMFHLRGTILIESSYIWTTKLIFTSIEALKLTVAINGNVSAKDSGMMYQDFVADIRRI